MYSVKYIGYWVWDRLQYRVRLGVAESFFEMIESDNVVVGIEGVTCAAVMPKRSCVRSAISSSGNMVSRLLITLIIPLLSICSLYAQPSTKQQKEIECHLRSVDTLLASKNILQPIYLTPELSSIDVEDINIWAADIQKSKFSESGLELSAGHDYKFWNYSVVDDAYEGGDIISYKHRFLVSLKWNIMQSGMIARENYRQKVDLLARTKSQAVVNSTIKEFIIESAEQQLTNLYAYYNVLIDTKVDLYGALIEMQSELAATNRATMLSLSDLRIKRANTLRMRKSGVPPMVCRVIDIDNYIAAQNLFVEGQYDSLKENNNSIIKNKLEQELTQNEANGISYWREVKVSPYVRVANYLDEDMNSKNVGNLGVTASFPLFNNTKSKRREVASRGKLLENDEQVLRKDIALQITDLMNQLNENLVTLRQLIEAAKYYSEGCILATQYYNNKTMTIYDLSQRYIDNLDNNIEIYKLIIEREVLRHTLFKVIYGVPGYRL